MSCIYGTHQMGVEDQGWIAWFTIATLLNKPLTIYGDGTQVRDVLWVSDLIDAYDKFIKTKVRSTVFNIGGGRENTLSLIELLKLLKELTGERTRITFEPMRPADQEVYISDIRNVCKKLDWEPKIDVRTGLCLMIDWVRKNKGIFNKKV